MEKTPRTPWSGSYDESQEIVVFLDWPWWFTGTEMADLARMNHSRFVPGLRQLCVFAGERTSRPRFSLSMHSRNFAPVAPKEEILALPRWLALEQRPEARLYARLSGRCRSGDWTLGARQENIGP